MPDIFNYLIPISLGAVFLVLLAGLVNLVITRDKARSRSNQLMRLRVLVQFVAVIILCLAGYFVSQAGP